MHSLMSYEKLYRNTSFGWCEVYHAILYDFEALRESHIPRRY